MTDKLKECPFCGAAPELKKVGRDWYRIEHPHVTECLLDSITFDYGQSDEGLADGVGDWNRRAPLPAVEAAEIEVRVIGYAPGMGQVTVELPPGKYPEWSSRLELGETVRILAGVNQQAGSGVPEGWRLVPVEPTEKMLEAGYFTDAAANRGTYQQMIDAAPLPPSPAAKADA